MVSYAALKLKRPRHWSSMWFHKEAAIGNVPAIQGVPQNRIQRIMCMLAAPSTFPLQIPLNAAINRTENDARQDSSREDLLQVEGGGSDRAWSRQESKDIRGIATAIPLSVDLLWPG
jgi:hypothetical protein